MKSVIALFLTAFIFTSAYSQFNLKGDFSPEAMNRHNMNSWPQWSPDGQKIAFVSRREGNAKLYLMNADGTNIHKIADGKGAVSSPKFSPDGSKIIFDYSSDGASQIYKIDTDGNNLTRLTQTENNEYSPCWSPSGDKIIFQSERDTTAEIYVMNPDGSDPVRISHNNHYNNSFPLWSPDGSKIYFCSVKLPHDFRNSLFDFKGDSCYSQFLGSYSYNVDAFSKDSKKLLYHSLEFGRYSNTSDLYYYDFPSKTSIKIKKNIDNLEKADFINSDSLLLTTDGTLSILDINTGKMHSIFKNKNKVVSFTLNNKTILFDVEFDKRDICIIKTDGTGFKDLTK